MPSHDSTLLYHDLSSAHERLAKAETLLTKRDETIKKLREKSGLKLKLPGVPTKSLQEIKHFRVYNLNGIAADGEVMFVVGMSSPDFLDAVESLHLDKIEGIQHFTTEAKPKLTEAAEKAARETREGKR